MPRPGRPALFLLHILFLLGLAGLLAWVAPLRADAAAGSHGKRKPAAAPRLRARQGSGRAPKAVRPRGRKRARGRDARLAAIMSFPHFSRPAGPAVPPSPQGLTGPEREALEESLQEEIAPPAESVTPPPPAEAPFVWPVVGRLNSPFGPRRARFHAGIDIAGRQGHPVAAAAEGVVLYARGSRGPLGKTVVLEHEDGLRTVYAHLSKIGVREGAAVRQGEPIGAVGRTGRATGPHLHFEVRQQGRPVMPQLFLPGGFDGYSPRLASSTPRLPSAPAAPEPAETPGPPPPVIEPAS